MSGSTNSSNNNGSKTNSNGKNIIADSGEREARHPHAPSRDAEGATRDARGGVMNEKNAPGLEAGAYTPSVAARFHPAFSASRPTPPMRERIAAVNARRRVTVPRWEPVRAIVQNYFVIPYQEFHFVNGCLVLGGGNSTGKTSVLTALVTLVLDNDKRSERLDPSGKRVRSIGYYVLGKPEMRFFHKNRISYIALEFQHTGTGEYRTIGIGVQGHRAGSDGHAETDSWGFLIADGRRIGPDHEISLFDEAGDKRIPLSRSRLMKVLGADLNPMNRVVDDIDAYREMVNAAFFGFRSDRQFGDLLSILTALRASKLANTIKPSVVNEFLQRSLRPLDETLMEDAGRVYERIDQYQDRLDLLTEQVIVLDDLAKAEAAWRLAGARREAGLFLEAYRDADRAIKRLDRIRDDITRERSTIAKAETTIAEHAQKAQEKDGRLTVLLQRDELKDINKLTEYEQRLEEAKHVEAQAVQAAKSARERHDEMVARIDTLVTAWNVQIAELLSRARDLADTARSAWSTAQNFATAVVTSARHASIGTPTIAPTVTIGTLRADHEVQRDSLQDISKALRGVESAETTYQAERDRRASEAADLQAASEALQQRREEERVGRVRATEALRLWVEGARTHIGLPADLVEDVITHVLDPEIDPDGLTDPYFSAIAATRTAVRADEGRHAAALVLATQRGEEINQRLEAKRAEREETPVARAERMRAREALAAAGVAVAPLYQAVDFAPNTPDEQAGHLEHLLEEAGLLDALLFSATDESRAKSALAASSLDTSEVSADVWLATTSADALPAGTRTLADYLIPASDLGSKADVTAALRSVVVSEESTQLAKFALAGRSAIALDGGWVHGAVSGHATGTRERGRYIGLLNRQRARVEAIARLEAEFAEAKAERDRINQEVTEISERLSAIEGHEQSLRTMASIRALPTLRSQVESADRDVAKYEERLAIAEQRVAQARVAFTEAKQRLDTACHAIQWTGERSHDAVERAISTLHRLRDEAEAIHRRLDPLSRVAADHANATGRMPQLAQALTAAKVYVGERGHAVTRAMSQVEAIKDLLAREDIKALTNEVAELRFALKQLEIAVNDQKSIREKADGRLERAEADLPDREATATSLQQKAGSQYENLLVALAAHTVTATAMARANQGQPEAALVCESLLEEFTTEEQNAAALDSAREAAFNAMDRIRSQHTTLLTLLQPAVDRQAGYTFVHHGRQLTTAVLLNELADEEAKLEKTLGEDQRTLAQKFMSEEILSAIHGAIEDTREMIRLVNAKLGQLKSTKSKQLRFTWRPIRLAGMTTNVAEIAKLLDTKVTYWSDDERATLLRFIEERLAYVRSLVKSADATFGYVEALKNALDYRNWYEFTMEVFEKRWIEFSDKEFGTGSEGEKAVDMLAPLFAVVHARYANALPDAPRLIGMDEAMAGLDATNTKALFGLLSDFEFAFIMTSEKLWGVSESLTGCATYQLQVDQPKDPSVFAATMFLWDGIERVEDEVQLLVERASSTPGTQRELTL